MGIDIIWAKGFTRVWFVASANYIMPNTKQGRLGCD